MDLFAKSSVINLNDSDFRLTKLKSGKIEPKLINSLFRGKDGYIMIYAAWCPHCQAKQQFWSYLGEQFNRNPKFAKENFRIGAINAENPAATKIVEALKVGPIPRFIHVIPDKKTNTGSLSDYQGSDLSPESLIREICDLSPNDTLC